MSGKRYIGIAVVAALLWAPWPPRAWAAGLEQGAATEDDLRAAFVLNFVRFITWPGEHPDHTAPLVIGVWADPGLAGVLTRVVNGQTVRGRRLAVRIIKELRQAGEVNILYVASAGQKQLGRWLAENAGAAILTISDNRDFCKLGGMIALYSEGRRMRFEINPESLQRSGLRASSKLLALSKSGGGGQ
jgi:hypothetical protein